MTWDDACMGWDMREIIICNKKERRKITLEEGVVKSWPASQVQPTNNPMGMEKIEKERGRMEWSVCWRKKWFIGKIN